MEAIDQARILGKGTVFPLRNIGVKRAGEACAEPVQGNDEGVITYNASR